MRYFITLIAIVFIVVIIAGPSLIGAFSDLGDRLDQWVKYGWEFDTDGNDDEVTDGNGDNGDQTDNVTEPHDSNGQLSMGVTINFMDGTSQTVGPEEMVFTLFPMTIFFEGKEVSEIWWHCYIVVDWVGDIETFKVSGPMKVTSKGITLKKEGMLKSYSGGELPKNEWFEVWKFGLTALDIEYSLGSGDYTLTSEAIVTAEAMFSDGHKETKEATATTDLPITIEEGALTVFNVEIQVQSLNP